MTRVLVVDDQAVFRTGLVAILGSQPDLEVVGEAGDGAQAVALGIDLEPDVVLMDVRMPVLDGIEATRRLTAAPRSGPRPTPVRVLMLTTFDIDDYVFDALRAGASGFLLKDAGAEDLIAAVRTIAAGDALLAPRVTRHLVEAFIAGPRPAAPPADVLAVLTGRERDVFMLMARGRSNGEIGRELFIAEQTVKTHVGRVLAKLQLRDRVHAVVLAYESGLVTPAG